MIGPGNVISENLLGIGIYGLRDHGVARPRQSDRHGLNRHKPASATPGGHPD